MDSIISFFQNFFETLWNLVLPSIFKIFLIVVITFFLKHLVNIGVENLKRKSQKIRRAETLSQIIYSTSKVIIIVIALMMILHELGLDIRPIIASAGILGLAVSLGAQGLMKDVVNGFFILLEDQFGIGDTINIGSDQQNKIEGKVEKMNLRITTIRDLNGNIHIIPNGQINQVTILVESTKQ